MFNDSKQKDFRRKLRHNLTYPEFIFWQAVRGKSLGVKFRRQQGFGRYIVDFYASEVRLIVEIDGDSHFSDEEKSADEVRTHFLGGLGMTVLRFTNRQIMNEKQEVLDFLRRHINQLQRNTSKL